MFPSVNRVLSILLTIAATTASKEKANFRYGLVGSDLR